MSPSLDLSVPNPPRSRGVAWTAVFAALSAALSAAVLVLFFVKTGAPAGGDASVGPPAEELKELAEDLERRTLYAQAAEVWGEYEKAARPQGRELALLLYRRGKCLKEAGDYARAARFLTQVERLDLDRETKRNAHRLLLECLSALGKESVRERVLRSFSVPGAEEASATIARVGGDPITIEDLKRDLEFRLRSELLLAGPASPEEVRRRAREEAEARLQNEEERNRLFQEAVTAEVLYREALARGLDQGEEGRELQEAVERFRRRFLARKLLDRTVAAALSTIGPTDLRNHYEAHKDRYRFPAEVEFSYARFETEEAARAAIEGLAAGSAGGGKPAFVKAEAPARSGAPLAGIGISAEANALLFALNEGETAKRPVRIDGSWYVFRADRKRAARPKTFEEAEEEVRRDLARLKGEEAVRRLEEELARRYRVEILAPPPEGERPAAAGNGQGEGAPGEPAERGAPSQSGNASSSPGNGDASNP